MKNQSLVYRTRCNQKTLERNKGASKYRTMSKYPEYTEKPTVRNKLKGCRDQKMGHPLTDTSSEAEIGQLQEPLYGTLFQTFHQIEQQPTFTCQVHVYLGVEIRYI